MLDLMQDQMAADDLRKAAYHEAGHKIIYELFGGAGDAVVWENESVDPDEVTWLGQFRPRRRPEQQHGAWARAGLNVPALPLNWLALYGMAGIVAEQILRGETDVEFIAGHLYLRICCDEISATDAAAIGVIDIDNFEVDIESVEQCANLLLGHWWQVKMETEGLIADASAEARATANV